MRTYQVLSLIGCILGILMMMGWFVIAAVGSGLTEGQGPAAVGLTNIAGLSFLSLLIYTGILIITFVIKQRVKLAGILILSLGVLATISSNVWGIIALFLLVPAGIVALRWKPRERVYREEEE
jgi:hypothetical protein